MPHKQLFLHEFLKEDQEPFHLKTYISERKSQMKTPKSVLQLTKRKQIHSKRINLCFLPFQNSPDVMRSPLFDFPSPVKVKSPTNANAALLVEAASRVKKSQEKTAGFGLFGTFLRRLKERKKRGISTSDIKSCTRNATLLEEKEIQISCSCSSKSLDFDASTSSCNSDSSETRFCTSPFRFSLHRSPSSSSVRTPEFCTPAASPSRHLKQDEEKYELSRNSSNVQGDEEEEKEQCSPVSVLDPPFEDANEEDYDLECCYQNVERAKQQLMCRLRRFEELANLDPIELEAKLLEGSDDESVEEKPTSLYTKLVSDLIVEENSETFSSGGTDVVMGRVCKRFDSWKQVEFNSIDYMVGLDLKQEIGGWTRFNEQVEETAAEIELLIFLVLVEELSM